MTKSKITYNSKSLVTGASGFIGRCLCKKLLDENHLVVAIIHKKPLEIGSCIEEKVDITNQKSVEDIIRKYKIENVFHLAATRDTGGLGGYEELIRANVIGTKVIISAAVNCGVKNFIYSSAMGVYGKPQYLPVDEKHELKPANMYNLSKLFGEQTCHMFSDKIKLIILRYSSVYGQGQEDYKAVPTFMKNAISGKCIKLDGDGLQSSDFVFVDDVVKINIKAIGKTGVFNIGSGKETTTKELAETIIHLTNSSSKIKKGGKGGDRHFRFYYSIEKAKRAFGFVPTPLEQGLKAYRECL
jgi:UDP-glucose 4-epimerase